MVKLDLWVWENELEFYNSLLKLEKRMNNQLMIKEFKFNIFKVNEAIQLITELKCLKRKLKREIKTGREYAIKLTNQSIEYREKKLKRIEELLYIY